MKNFLKVYIGISLVVVAASAHATITTIGLESAGSWATSADPTIAFVDTESVYTPPSFTAPFATLTDLTMTFDESDPFGTAVYTSAGNELDLELDVTDVTYSLDNLTRSIDGIWVYTGGTGSYNSTPTNIADGDGTFAVSQTSVGFSGTVLVGTLYAVPEPAPFAALGLGALGLLIRRRRSR
jgi:hypothetical protein